MKTGFWKRGLGLVFLLTLISANSTSATEYFVIIDDDDRFKPQHLQIQLGDKVTWIHKDYTFAPHASISDDGYWDSGDMGPDDRFSIIPPITGTFFYFDYWSAATGSITVVGGNSNPSITITNPIADATFAAPATFTFSASASDSDGNIVSVEFFVNGNSVGVDETADPYSAIVSNLTAGDHVLSALATDNSGGTTIDFINITVIDSAIRLSAPKILDGQFQCTISGLLLGKTNVVQASTNLVDWTSIQTNIAAADSYTFTNTQPAVLNPQFYRVIQLP